MAGHSKWANIKFRKAKQDKQRGKVFTKLIREITSATRMSGGDPNATPRLRAAIDKALGMNMTKDTIERARKRGIGDQENMNLAEVRYEGYGPAGVAVIVDCLTDNKNRTVADVRHAFSKCGGNLGTEGSVGYLFTERGVISFAPHSDGEKVVETAIEAGAEDVRENDDHSLDVITLPEQFISVKEALVAVGLNPENAEITMIASTEVTLDQENAEQLIKLQDILDDLDDVQEVYHNANFPAT